jgi:hypothetical protein
LYVASIGDVVLLRIGGPERSKSSSFLDGQLDDAAFIDISSAIKNFKHKEEECNNSEELEVGREEGAGM